VIRLGASFLSGRDAVAGVTMDADSDCGHNGRMMIGPGPEATVSTMLDRCCPPGTDVTEDFVIARVGP
jgi:hypothetical protein